MSFYTFNSDAFFRKLLLTISLFALPFACAFGLFNYYNDPLSIFNYSFDKYSWSERQIKSQYVRQHHDFDVVVFGSSKAAEIQFDQPKNKDDFNLSFSAATPEEMRYFAEHFDFKANVVLIGIDYFMFNSSYLPYMTPKQMKSGFGLYGPGDMYKYLFSFQTTFYALRDWWRTKHNEPKYYNDRGSRSSRYREDEDATAMHDFANAIKNAEDKHFRNFKLEERRFDDLKALCQKYEGTDTKVILFINPHEKHIYEAAEKVMDVPALRKRILATCKNSVDYSYMDEEKYFWRQDPIHYYPSTADKIIRDLAQKFDFRE